MYNFTVQFISIVYVRWEDALSLLQITSLFPASENDVVACVQKYKLEADCIKAVADDTIIYAAEALKSLYGLLSQEMELNGQKKRAPMGTTSSLAQKLHDIKNRASALTAFATSARDCWNRSDTPAKVARLDVSVSLS